MLVIANWKMFFTQSQANYFFSSNQTRFAALSSRGVKILICPSFTALSSLKDRVRDAGIDLCAQTCSSFAQGAFTGFIGIEDLIDVGCTYCLVGHSEQRLYGNESNADVAEKAVSLFKKNIVPIICIGENKKEREEGLTEFVIKKQLEIVLDALPKTNKIFYIAYEPVWAIGTGIVPTVVQIEEVFSWLKMATLPYSTENNIKFLYGGSVTAKNCSELMQVTNLGGFLVGKASIDFQEFEKIVNCIF